MAMLSVSKRQEIESRLANYYIPYQILQIVAEHCECSIPLTKAGTSGSMRNSRASSQLAALNDESVILLQKIFLDCEDSLSSFRLAVFLSSKWLPISYKFTMNETVAGKSGNKYALDVCVYSRNTEELVTFGVQNNNTEQKASGQESLSKFLAAVDDIYAAHPGLRSAYYASSYGYDRDPSRLKRSQAASKVDVKFLQYKNSVYFENKTRS